MLEHLTKKQRQTVIDFGTIAGQRPLTEDELAQLWRITCEAAADAAQAQNTRLGNESTRGLDCGFAWVTLPGNHRFTRWLKKHAPAAVGNGYPRGKQIWYSHLHHVPTQSISVHEAACKAARDVLSYGLQTSEIGFGSRLD